MSWYLNPALTRFRNEVNERWPNRDKRSDGTIGDAAHQATDSDHNPDPDGSVDAWDMDTDGVDVEKVIAAALAHESIQYVIYNRRITSRSWGLGTWRPYTGSSPHTEHVHFNTRSSHERSTKPWFEEEEDDVSAQEVWDQPMTANETGVRAPAAAFLRAADVMRKVDVPEMKLALSAILAAVQGADDGAILARIDQRAAELREAVGQVDEAVAAQLGALATPEEQAALLRAVLGDRAAAVGALLAGTGT